MTPAGVQGAKPLRPRVILPTFAGWNASTSLRRRYRFDDLALVDAFRERKLNKHAVDSFVSVQALHEAYKFILGSVFSGRMKGFEIMPISSQSFILLRTYTREARVFADKDHCKPRGALSSGDIGSDFCGNFGFYLG